MEEIQNAKRLYESLNKTGKLDREVLCVRGRMKLRDRRYRVGECGLVREGLMAGFWGRSSCVPRSLLRAGHTETRPDPRTRPTSEPAAHRGTPLHRHATQRLSFRHFRRPRDAWHFVSCFIHFGGNTLLCKLISSPNNSAFLDTKYC